MAGSLIYQSIVEGARVPHEVDRLKKAHNTDAGYDLQVFLPDHLTVKIGPGEKKMVGTGVRVQIPEGYVGLLFGRSSLATKTPFQLANCVGVIDCGYTGEVKLVVRNTSDKEDMWLSADDRIAQLVVVPIFSGSATRVSDLSSSEHERGEGGFGSTGYTVLKNQVDLVV